MIAMFRAGPAPEPSSTTYRSRVGGSGAENQTHDAGFDSTSAQTKKFSCPRTLDCDDDPIRAYPLAAGDDDLAGSDRADGGVEMHDLWRQMAHQLRGDGPHTLRRHRHVARQQALEDDIEHAAARL